MDLTCYSCAEDAMDAFEAHGSAASGSNHDDEYEDAVSRRIARACRRLACSGDGLPNLTACKEDTWDAIRKAGPAVEAEVLRALRDQLPITSTSAPKLARSNAHVD